MLLSAYITQVRRLLNDAQKNYWTNTELGDYVNEARVHVAVDTLCIRKFQTATLTAGQEAFEYNSLFVSPPQVVDLINVTLIWGNTRVPLGYLPFTTLSGYLRTQVNYRRLPFGYSIYNASQFWVAPPPDIDYVGEFDTAVLPANLANDNTVDTIPPPYDEAVKFYAAMLARLQLQQYSEAKAQKTLYTDRIAELGQMPPRRIPYVYSNDWVP